MRSKLIQSILVICMLVPSFSFAESKWLDKVIALVESDVILDSEFKRRLNTVKKQLSANGAELPPEDAIKKQVLEKLVMDQIQLQKATNAGVRISDDELSAALNRIAESNNTTLVLMKAQIEEEGLNFPLFREDIRQEMSIARYRQGAVSRNIFVSEQEVDDILALMNERGASSITYHLRHLMIAIDESAGPDEIDRANAKVASIIKRYKAGEIFSNLVVAESDASDAIKGGDLGWKSIDQLPTLFSQSVTTLEKGQVSDPIRSANGLHLLMLEEKKGDEGKLIIDEINYRHILIKVTEVMTDEKAKAQLLSIRKDVLSGEAKFEEQAKVYSEDLATASSGGDLGWAPPDLFKSIYLDKVDNLKNGELSEVFKGGNGWYLVEQMGTRKTDQTKEMKRLKARRILQNRKYTEEQESWLREIREEAYVKILNEE